MKQKSSLNAVCPLAGGAGPHLALGVEAALLLATAPGSGAGLCGGVKLCGGQPTARAVPTVCGRAACRGRGSGAGDGAPLRPLMRLCGNPQPTGPGGCWCGAWCGGSAVCAQQNCSIAQTGGLPQTGMPLLLQLLALLFRPRLEVGLHWGAAVLAGVAAGAAAVMACSWQQKPCWPAACLVLIFGKAGITSCGSGSSQQKSETFPQAINNVGARASLTVCGPCAGVLPAVVGTCVLGQGMPDGARP